MSNIFVPIDHTSLKASIPPEEEILYSTMCKVVEKYDRGVGTTRTKKVRYNSHVLITNKKIYYFRNKKSPELQYLPLNSIVIKPDNHLHYVFGMGINFTLIIQLEYESKEAFNERKKKFDATMLPILINVCKEHIKEQEGKDLKFIERGYIKKLKKRIPKMEQRIKTKYP